MDPATPGRSVDMPQRDVVAISGIESGVERTKANGRCCTITGSVGVEG